MSMSRKPSSSSYQRLSSSSGSSESRLSIDPGIGRHRWFRLLGLAFIAYLLLLPVWWYCLGVLTFLAGVSADLIYHVFDSAVSITPDGRIVNVSVAAVQSGLQSEAHRSALNISTITYGLPMLAALILATGSRSIWSKARALVIGVATMAAVTIPAVLLWAKITSLELDQQVSGAAGRGGPASYFYYVFHGYAFSQPVVAVAIWMAMMMLGAFDQKGEQAIRARQARPAPDAQNPRLKSPCPCGSGRRYKNCCGRRSRPEPTR
jgi:hypothetical protein